MKKLFIHIFIFSCLYTFSNAKAQTECDTDEPIVFGGLDWDSDRFHVTVASFILENGYGCKTDVIPGSSLPLLTALANGDIDVLMEVWKENVNEAWSEYESEGKVEVLSVNFPDAVQGFYVPSYLIKGDPKRGIEAKAPNLKSVDQLPDYKSLFQDPENPEFGRFYNCILGWTCEVINSKKLKAYGLDKHYTNFRPGAAAALASAIASAYERGEPILAYYWGPTWVLGRYDLTMIEEPAYDPKIWEQFTKDENPTQATAYPTIEIYIGANTGFTQKSRVVPDFLKRYQTSSELISEALAYMDENEGATIEDAAHEFLKKHSELWRKWVPAKVARKVEAALEVTENEQKQEVMLKIDAPINDFVNHVVNNYSDVFDAIAKPLRSLILKCEKLLLSLPWWLFISLVAVFSFFIQAGLRLLLITSLSFLFIASLGLWSMAMQTLALMIIATIVATILGVPFGILLAKNDRLRSLSLPILDAMQTMPSFVYLIPALMLFGLGKVPALFATVIYAIPPLIKLTDLGIRNVDTSVIEATRSFGANNRQLLVSVELPLALPTIMAGINQTTMLALSMVVIASMIGARGLGEQVLLGIQRLDVGQGFTAGIAIVALAIILDRITQASGKRFDKSR